MSIKATPLLRDVGTMLAAVCVATLAQTALAQNPASSPSSSLSLPRPDFHFKGQVGRTYLDSDPATFPQLVRPPKGAPNIVLILLDDVGFGQFSTFGGGVPSPTMDEARGGGPALQPLPHDRAVLARRARRSITGRNHHIGGDRRASPKRPPDTTATPASCRRAAGTVAEVLRQNGYTTAWIGKNHNTPDWETSAAGPFDRWANGLGFDYFYGFNAGDMNQCEPDPVREPQPRPAFERSELPPHHRHRRQGDRLDAAGEGICAGPAVLPLRRARRDARAASRAEGVDRQVQGPVRHGLGQATARQTLGTAEEARRRPAGHQAHRALRGPAGLGLAQRRPEAALRAHDGGLRRLWRPCRPRDGPRRRRGASSCPTPTTR